MAALLNDDTETAAGIFMGLGNYRDSSAWYTYSMRQTQYSQERIADHNPEEWLIGHWEMREARKNDHDDVISFPIDIISIDQDGKAVIDWGGSGRIEGIWNRDYLSLTVFKTQEYILAGRVLGGGNQNYSGIAVKKDTVFLDAPDTIIGSWKMVERRHTDNHDDEIVFDVRVVSIDENGTADVFWGDSNEITGTWDAEKGTLTVFKNHVYIFHNGFLGGGSKSYKGIATGLSE